MFVGNCSGCFQVPTNPVYYWSPYPSALLKKPTFQISDILQVKNHHNSAEERILLKKYEGKFEELVRNAAEHKSNLSNRVFEPRDSVKNSGSSCEAINYSRKGEGVRCSLPSALEPLQALCSSTHRVYGGLAGAGSESSSTKHSTSTSTSSSPSDLKFGISRILEDDFGQAKQNKENSQTESGSDTRTRSSLGHRRAAVCECTAESCYLSQRLAHGGFPSAALSAVHALQPPKYPHSPPGTDTLPGPYSVLNTDVSMMGAHSKRKRSWSRAVFSNLQRKGLEKRFEVQKYVTKPDRRQLAAMLGLTDAQVKVWFQNRRMKWRHAQQQNNDIEPETNSSCDKPEAGMDDDAAASMMEDGDEDEVDIEVHERYENEDVDIDIEHSTEGDSQDAQGNTLA